MKPKLKKLMFGTRKSNIIVLMVGAVLYFVFPKYVVATHSMEPTIPAGSLVIALRSFFVVDEIENEDIIVFKPVEGISEYPWVHRVKATQGEVFVPFERGGRKDTDKSFELMVTNEGIMIPEGYVYQSGDSNKSYHGLANCDLISSKVLFSFKLPWK